MAYVPTCTDADGDAVAVSLVANTCGGALAGGTFGFTPGESAGGATCEATFRCHDGQAQVDTRVAFTIAETNAAPAFTGTPYTTSARWGRTGQLAAAATDGDLPAQALTFSLASTDCAFPVTVSAAGVVDYTCGGTASCGATLRVSDGTATAQAPLSLTCTNAVPRALNVAVNPGVAYNDTVLTCAYAFDDADGDPDLSAIAWLVNGAPIAATDPTLAGAFGPGDRVRCRVTPHDGLAEGETVTSAEVTIGNRTPVVANVVIDPAPIPAAGAPLDCQYDFSDADGDGDQSLVEWLVGGVVVGSGQGFSQYVGEDNVACRVTPHDGRVAGVVRLSATSAAPLRHLVSAGEFNVCATLNGALYCWGQSGYLGDGNREARYTPTAVTGLTSGVTAVRPGDLHSCALHNGALKCWGYNALGELGDGTYTNRSVPTAVTGLGSGVTAFTASGFHTCAIQGGALKCWGNNSAGQLGDGTTNNRPVPTAVTGLGSGVTAVGVGTTHTCALHNGALKCWGVNTNGQLGDGTAVSHPTPTTVPGLESGVTAISVGNTNTCAIHSGALKCWGDNSTGLLGTGNTTSRSTPTLAVGLESGVTAVATRRDHTCALHNGALKCWGMNNYGQLGHRTAPYLLAPAAVPGFETGVTAITVGGARTCVVQNGELKCWGSNVVLTGLTPTALSADAHWTSPAAGDKHTCSIHNGGLKCWGYNYYGQLGEGTRTNRSVPTDVPGLDSGVTAVVVSSTHTCALHNGALKCWGENQYGQVTASSIGGYKSSPTAVAGLASGVSAVAAGNGFTCAVHNDVLKCWGYNAYGQIGDATTTTRYTPVNVSGVGLITTLTAGANHACVVESGALKCWGRNNDYGEIGDGTLTNRTVPTALPNLASGVTHASAGTSHTCAIQNGALKCWGYNVRGQLGNGNTTNSSTPVAVSGLDSGVSAVSANGNNTCALHSGALKCWGTNLNGQLGDGDGIDTSNPIPVPVAGLETGVTVISMGTQHVCAIQDGTAKCWGSNVNGQLGFGLPFVYEPTPITLP